MSDDISFMNMDVWKGGGGKKFQLTYKGIILMHINRCVINGSTEWHGGFWEETLVNTGMGGAMQKRYIYNSREVYNNSIKMLRAILLGYFDDKMKLADKKIKDDFLELEKNYKGNESDYIYKDKKVDLHLRLFEELLLLSKRENFFEEESVEDEA